MDSLFNRNTDGVIGSESSEPNTASQHAASGVPAAVVNPLYAGESAGEHTMPTGTSAPAPDTCTYVAEPAPQQTAPTKECDGKQPGRATNLLLVATLAAVCGLAGGLTGGAIMSAATGGSTQAAQGSMGGGQGGMQGGGAPSGQAPTGAPGASGSSDTSADGSTDGSNGVLSDLPSGTGDSSATSQTSLSV